MAALTATCILSTGCGGTTEDTDSRLQAVIDGMTRAVFAGNGLTGKRQLFHLPAAALTVQSGSGDAETFTSGSRDLESGAPLESSDIQPIGSNTKVVTAVLVMRLVEQGKIGVDDLLTHVASSYDGDGGVLRRLVERYRDRLENVRLRELLNHTSGLADSLGNAWLAAMAKNPLRSFTLAQLAALGLSQAPVFSPGAPGRWNYSNTDYHLLGMVLEAVTGESAAEQMQALFDEIGMTDTHYSPSPEQMGGAPIADSLAHGYMPGTGPTAKQPPLLSWVDSAPTVSVHLGPAAVRIVSSNPSESGPTVRVTVADPAEAKRVERHTTFTYKDVTRFYNLSFAQTAGGIVTNTEDLARFYRALFDGKLVDAETLARMERTVPTGESSKGVRVRWGFGFGQQEIAPGVLYPGSPRLTVWMHLGDIFGWESAAYYVEQKDMVVTNTDNLFPTPIGDLGLLRDVLRVEGEED